MRDKQDNSLQGGRCNGNLRLHLAIISIKLVTSLSLIYMWHTNYIKQKSKAKTVMDTWRRGAEVLRLLPECTWVGLFVLPRTT